jgi:hypothetical protein
VNCFDSLVCMGTTGNGNGKAAEKDESEDYMMLMNTDLREGECRLVVECIMRCCAVCCCRIVVYFLSDVRDNRRARRCVVSFRCPAGVVWSVLLRFIHVKLN